jgi:ribonuclease HI
LKYKDSQKIIKGSTTNTTNNKMELKAVIEGLKALKEPCEVKIVSDSTYVVKGASQWLDNWIKKDFKKIKNEDLWREYIKESQKHKIDIHWVKAHNGHKENEICDEIANNEATKLKENNK